MDVVDELMVFLTTELGELKQEILDEFKKIDFKQDLDLLSTNNQLCPNKEQLEFSRQELESRLKEIELNNKELRLSKEQLELENQQLKLENKQLQIDNNMIHLEKEKMLGITVEQPSVSSINILKRFL